jgi:hypothetical protein
VGPILLKSAPSKRSPSIEVWSTGRDAATDSEVGQVEQRRHRTTPGRSEMEFRYPGGEPCAGSIPMASAPAAVSL